MGWSSNQAEDSDVRYYVYQTFNSNYLAVDEYSSTGWGWTRYVFTRNNTSYSSDKNISETQVGQSIVIPAGQKQIDAYIFAIDDEVIDEGKEG